MQTICPFIKATPHHTQTVSFATINLFLLFNTTATSNHIPYGYEFLRGLNFRGFRGSLNPRNTYFALTDTRILWLWIYTWLTRECEMSPLPVFLVHLALQQKATPRNQACYCHSLSMRFSTKLKGRKEGNTRTGTRSFLRKCDNHRQRTLTSYRITARITVECL